MLLALCLSLPFLNGELERPIEIAIFCKLGNHDSKRPLMLNR